jgi:hypothetical protein
MSEQVDPRAAPPPQPPVATPALNQALAEQRIYLDAQALIARRSTTRGLILLGLIALFASIARTGVHRVFLPGWWRH